MSTFIWALIIIVFAALSLIQIPTSLKSGLEAILGEPLEFTGLSFVLLAFTLRLGAKLVLKLIDFSVGFFQFLGILLDLIWANWNHPGRWVAGTRKLFKQKNHLVETAGIFYSLGNVFYLCLFLRPDLVLVALWQSVMSLSLAPVIALVSDGLTPLGILQFVLGLSGVGLFFYHTYFVDIFYGRYHDPVVQKTSLEQALPNRGYDVFGPSEFHCFEQEVRLAKSGHATFGGTRAAMFSFAMAILSERLEGKFRSNLLPAAFFEYLSKHSPTLRDAGYAVRSVLDPVLNPVGFSNLLALIAAVLVTAAEGIAVLTLSGDAALIHQSAFAAGFLVIVKKLGWILATVHGRVDLVFHAKAMRSLCIQDPPPPTWQKDLIFYFNSASERWPWFGIGVRRLWRDIWAGMGNLYAILGWFSLIVIEREYIVSAWDQVQRPLQDQPVDTLVGYGIAPLVGVVLYTILHNPEAPYRIGVAIFNLPAYWLYTKLADHNIDLPPDSLEAQSAEQAETVPVVSNINWLLQPEWQWFWDELFTGCQGSRQKYIRLQALMSNQAWRSQICDYLNIPTSDQPQAGFVRLAFMPIEPGGWFSFLRQPEEKEQMSKRAQRVIAGYLSQLDAAEMEEPGGAIA
ncbi:MAG: hypothetical protein AB4042_07095 [Leptolyngbyaceae cyanobacterium]